MGAGLAEKLDPMNKELLHRNSIIEQDVERGLKSELAKLQKKFVSQKKKFTKVCKL